MKIIRFHAAFDKTGTTDEALIGELARTGPPHILASYARVKSGFAFSIGDQVFRVVRMTNRKEWIERTKPPWLDGANPLRVRAMSDSRWRKLVGAEAELKDLPR